MKWLLLMAVLFLSLASRGQKSDLILLKKRWGKTMDRFYPGVYISVETHFGVPYEGYVKSIKNDTIFIEYYVIRSVAIGFGGIWPDTLARYKNQLCYKDISVVRNQKAYKRKNTMGSFLQIAGAGYLGLTLVNGVLKGEEPNEWFPVPVAVTGASLFVAGKLLNGVVRKKYPIKKKYRLQYIDLQKKDPQPM